MSEIIQNNKRIAKNTILLYIRMFFIMAVTLYTSRIVLSMLGVTDFGIYNVVGGVVAMMGVLNGAMSVSTQRYLTYEIGRNNMIRLKQVFNTCFFIYIIISFIVLLFAETIGLWFLNTKMIIPAERVIAANWVYQFSICACITSLLVNPFNATIIAHERMNVYAYIGILEVMFKLGIVFLLLVIPIDRLVAYSCLIFLSQLIVTVIYIIYCLKHFQESHFSFYWDKNLFKELVSYSGWNLFGSLTGLIKSHGLNILLNLFFNPAVNAARGIAYQINVAITQFFTNFYTAVRPQITKYYAQGNMNEMIKLIFRSSKFSFYLILIVSLPILIKTPYIIKLWLGQLPDYVVPFTRIIIIISAIDAISTPLMTAAHSTGKIRLYQSSVGTVTILNIPISYFFLKMGASPLVVFYVSLLISIICFFIRLIIVHRLIELPIKEYLLKVFGVSFTVSLFAIIPPLFLSHFLADNFCNNVIICFLCVISCLLFIYLIGLDNNERKIINEIIRKKINSI